MKQLNEDFELPEGLNLRTIHDRRLSEIADRIAKKKSEYYKTILDQHEGRTIVVVKMQGDRDDSEYLAIKENGKLERISQIVRTVIEERGNRTTFKLYGAEE